VFERFTDQARRVVVLAQEEARLLNHPYIGSEHALLGVLAEGHGTGAHTLRSLDVSIEMVRAKVVALVGRGDRAPSGHIPFTPQAKRALEGALREALHAGDHEIGTEHLLLGLIREGDSTAARVLTELGLDPDAVRQRVADLRAGPGDVHIAHGPPPRGGMSASGVPFGPPWSACSFCGRDLWEVDHYVVGNGAVICDVCVALARTAVDDAPSDDRSLRLPARVFGDPPDDKAVAEIVEVVELVLFSGPAGDATRAAGLEDGERLAPLQVQARRRHEGVDVEHRLDRIRFIGPDLAEVRVGISLVGGPGMTFEGRVLRIDGSWKVSRDLFCATVRPAGVECPPTESG
jgi:hypothetical protein